MLQIILQKGDKQKSFGLYKISLLSNYSLFNFTTSLTTYILLVIIARADLEKRQFFIFKKHRCFPFVFHTQKNFLWEF